MSAFVLFTSMQLFVYAKALFDNFETFHLFIVNPMFVQLETNVFAVQELADRFWRHVGDDVDLWFEALFYEIVDQLLEHVHECFACCVFDWFS